MPKALFHYYGGKQEQLKNLLAVVESIPHKQWVEAACGAANLTLAKEPAGVETINDIDDRLVCLFQTVRDAPAWLSKQIAATPFSRKVFEKCCAVAADENETPTRRGYAALVAMRQSFSASPGRTWCLCKNHSRRRMASSISRWLPLSDDIAQVANRLRTVQIECMDVAALITKYDSPTTLFYIDLPYPHSTRRVKTGYKHECSDDDHKRMLKAVIRAKGKFIISGYGCELYDKVLTEGRGWERDARSVTCRSAVTPTGMVHHDKTREEVLWIRR